MADNDKFCLKWNEFDSNVSKSFGIFRNEDYLHDVTLVSNDHKQLSAHKLVLSASSEYFKDILKNNKHPHPLLCIDGVSSEDMGNMIDYIYTGEVKIYQDRVDRFLTIAQRLQLKGLIVNEDDTVEKNENGIAKNGENEWKRMENWNRDDAVEQKVDTSVSQSNYRRRSSNTDRKLTVAVNGDDNQEIDAKVNECLETLPDGSLKCTLCGKEASQTNMKQSVRQNMTRHVATHLDGGSYSCQFCEKTFRSKNSLGSHRSIYHKNN